MTEYSAFLKHLGINQKQMIASMMKRIPDSEKLLIGCNGLVKRDKTMIIFPLKKEWYEKIKSGEKTVDYREVKPYWTKRFWHEGGSLTFNTISYDYEATKDVFPFPMICKLQLGYNPKTRLNAIIKKIEVIDGKDTDLHIDKPVYAIHLADVREVENA